MSKLKSMFLTFWILRIAILIFIVTAFVRLRRRYHKNALAFAVIAILTFVVGFASGLALMSIVLDRFPGNGFVLSLSKWSGLTSGGIATVVLYFILESRWRKETIV